MIVDFSFDTAVIKSQRADPSSKHEAYSNSELPDRPAYTSSHQGSQFQPSSHHPNPGITSSILGRSYNLESLANAASAHSVAGDAADRSATTTMISGVHDSHKLEQEQIHPVKQQRQAKLKKVGRSQVCRVLTCIVYDFTLNVKGRRWALSRFLLIEQCPCPSSRCDHTT